MSFLQSILELFCGSSKPEQPEPIQPVSPREIQQHQPIAHPYPQQPQESYPPQPIPVKPHQRPFEQPQVSPPGPHHPPPSTSPPRRPQYHDHIDPNQVNQHDERYTSLRSQARDEGDQMARAFQQSREAYARGDGALAKQLSVEGKEHQRKMDDLNRQASDWIFLANNKDSQPGEVDLHGLFVKEAIARTDFAIQGAKQRGESQVRLIVGKGLHSEGGIAKIKPAIEELMQKEQLTAELDPHNEGVLIVHIDGQAVGDSDSVVDADEITHRLERDKGCIIM